MCGKTVLRIHGHARTVRDHAAAERPPERADRESHRGQTHRRRPSKPPADIHLHRRHGHVHDRRPESGREDERGQNDPEIGRQRRCYVTTNDPCRAR